MSLGQVNSGFNLLGQGAATAARMAPIPTPPPESVIAEPKLDVPWGDFRQSLWSSLRTLVSGPFTAGKFLGGDYFRDCWVERRMPWRAVVAAALWHVVFVLSPFSLLPTTVRHNSAFYNTQLTWSGPIEDFPALEIHAAKPKIVSHGEPDKPLPPKGADAFHPRQRIVTDPVHPTHPRQTLLNPVAPQLAPKILPEMPNIVQLQAPSAPARPHIQISAEALAKLHPRQHHVAAVTSAPLPDVPNFEQTPAELSLAASPNAPARPKLDLNAGAAPRVAERAQTGDSVAAPEIGAAQPAANGNPATLIALSALPAAPKGDVQPPQGNLAARISISPEGTKPGVPDGLANASADPSGGAGAAAASSGGGKSPIGISISGGNPQPNASVSGLGSSHAKLSLPSSRALMTRPDANSKSEDSPERTGPPNFATLPPGAKPEQIFAAKRVYTLAVNMANINSASGSWILHFAELGSGPGPALSASSELAMPVPVRKVDPKFPPDLVEQNVQGEVVLYGIVRADGSVDSIQVARGLDPQLDANAKSAFAQWKFQPGSKSGTPIELEVIAHIPFKIRDDR
ncbi:MAG TPA: TonB family protein [Candidatus Acidoferrum sp.]|nr:TonB family protein [Candidatus Acidoferrum sp.]